MTDNEGLLMLTEAEFRAVMLLVSVEGGQDFTDEQLDHALWIAQRTTQRRTQEGLLRRYAEMLLPKPHARLADGRAVRDLTAGELGLTGDGPSDSDALRARGGDGPW